MIKFIIISILFTISLEFSKGWGTEAKETDIPQPSITIEYITQFGREGKGNDEFGGPFGIHISSDQRVYIADDLDHCIKIFDKKGRFLKRIGNKKGTSPGEFAYLDSVITDKKGNMYVADSGNNRVQMLDSEGKSLREIRRWGNIFGRKN